ncbi:MAG: hypothetical protein ACK5LC_02545 [Coprobacillaceae bacterium]
MKRITKILSVCLLLVTIVGCGGSGTKAQEEVITTFFDHIANGETKKLTKMFAKRADDEVGIEDFMEAIDVAFEEDYGKTWNKERKTFVQEVYKMVIESYEIKDLEADEDETTVKVKGKRIKLEDFYNDGTLIEDSKKLSDLYDDLEDAADDYDNDDITYSDYEELVADIYDEHAADYFAEVLKAFEDLGTTSFTITFTLEEDDGEWLIEELASKNEWGVLDSYDYSYDDYEYDYDTYEVDQEKCKPENTKLGKGRLLDSYKNSKYIDTPFEFLDYNVTNGEGTEVDDYGSLKLTDTVKFDIEVGGKVGDTFVLTIEDEDFEVLFSEEITLTEDHMVITKEISGVNVEQYNLYVKLYLAEGYNKEYNYGDSFGYFFLWND